MRGVSGISDVERLCAAVTKVLGLACDDSRLCFLEGLLDRRLEATGLPSDTYLARLEATEPARGEIAALAQELTVSETYFFRHAEQCRAFAEQALPDRLRARLPARRLRILSAGCSTGEEPYSLAILAREAVTDPSWTVEVLGVDVNPNVVEKGARGVYSPWSLRETSAAAQMRWFRPEGRGFRLDEAVRSAVDLQVRNLAEDDPGLWPQGAYDVVFCRNVLMYMAPPSAQAVVARLTRALAPGGYLFLGHAETLRGLSQDFHLCHTHGAFYYQRRNGVSPAPLPSPPADRERREDAPRGGDRTVSVAGLPSPGAWEGMGEGPGVRGARSRNRAEPAVPASPVTPAAGLGGALDLLRGDRFAEALALVRALPLEARQDADALLLQAVLLAHGGRLEEATATCRELLAGDDLNAGAHYVLALCREGAADPRGAIEHDQMAVYLDAGFAMPRLHLGILARRTGEHETARRELTQALALLPREDTSRLLLFGGGFGRDALLALCRAELAACGGRS